MGKVVCLVLGGSIGTLCRYIVNGVAVRYFSGGLPAGTLVVNLIGCLLVGFVIALPEERLLINDQMKILIVVGFLGAFTTFSTFMLEIANLIQNGHTLKAGVYTAVSIVVGFILVRIGIWLGSLV